MARPHLDFAAMLENPFVELKRARSVGWLGDSDIGTVGVLTHDRVRELLTDPRLGSGFVDQVRVYTGAVNGGEGVSMAEWLTKLEFRDRLDRESGPDAVLEAFLE